MPTVFIAVQCFQCCTMQVKQRKKSSNKWSCVVCNEKQSVRKVFAQGFMAKDVRKFVQSFNMSRLLGEQPEDLQPETLVPQSEEEEEENENQKKKRRTDWSEYMDPDKENRIEDDQGDELEPNVVTELPKALFKKPKLKNNYSSSAGFDSEDGEKLRKPVFGKRNVNKNINKLDKEPRTSTGTMVKANMERGCMQNRLHDTYADKEMGGVSKWGDCHKSQDGDELDCSSAYKGSSSMMTRLKRPLSKLNAFIDDGDNVDHSFAYKGSSSMMEKLKRPISKWNDFMDDGDDKLGKQIGQGANHVAFETCVSDETVEDDIHPDFQ